jgi:hypothetical protein
MKEAGHGSGGLAHDGDVVAVAAESRDVLLRANVIKDFFTLSLTHQKNWLVSNS